MADKALRLSVAIVCYQTEPDELSCLLETLLKNFTNFLGVHSGNRVDLYLIDNSESPLSYLPGLKALAELGMKPNISLSLMQGHGNIGYGKAHNLVLDSLNSDYHLILNTDLLINDDAVGTGIDYLEKNRHVVMAAPRVDSPQGDQQYLCKSYPAAVTLFVRGFLPAPLRGLFSSRLARYELRQLHKSGLSFDTEIASGCFMLCRTDALKTVGGFDARYFLYFEDFDLSLRIRKLGEISYLPDMKIIHGGGQAAGKGIKHIGYFSRSAMQFYKTHGWRWFNQ